MITFETGYSWLNQFNKSRLSQAAALLRDQLHAAIDAGEREKTLRLTEHLECICCDSENELEYAEARLEEARAYYRIGQLAAAEKMLMESIRRYGAHRHEVSVALWMLGCICLRQLDQHDRGITYLQKCRDAYEALAQSHYAHAAQAQWYKDRWEQMNISIKEVLDKGELFTKISQYWSMIDEIPAGGFGAKGKGFYQKGYSSIDQFVLEDKPHRLVSLKGSQTLSNWGNLSMLKVKADSMNLAGIEIGDYLLVIDAKVPAHDDIVAADIKSKDPYAIPKRYLLAGGSIILKPESDNPKYFQPAKFALPGAGFEIWGVVEAVFKPIE